MLNPESLNLSSLPWLPLEGRSAFPQQPAIYFAIDSQDVVHYIGRSINPKVRWAKHHRYKELDAIGNVRIAYLFVDSSELLPEIELALIAWFKPPLNTFGRTPSPDSHSVTRGVIRVRQVREIEVPGLGERIKAARIASDKSLTQICKEIGMSRSYWYDLESEKLSGTLSVENLREIEQVLGVDLGVKFGGKLDENN